MTSITGVDGKKNVWIIVVLFSILLFIVNLSLRYLFEKKIDIFYSVIVTLFFILAYFILTLFLNIRKLNQ